MSAVERQAVLAGRLSSVLRGEDRPKDAAERTEFAELLYQSKRYSLAAGLYAEAFAADPKIAENMIAGNRYNAACSAALAGAGQEEQKPPLVEKDKARWRQQALEWLKADLASWTKQAGWGPPQAKALISQILTNWKLDPDLAGIRNAEAIKSLPEEEQKACRALWTEVNQLLSKVQ